MDKKCKHCRSKLLEYYYNELSSVDKSSVDEHLAQCTSCKNYYNKLISVLDNIDVERITLTAQEKEAFVEKFHQRIKVSSLRVIEKIVTAQRQRVPTPWFVKVTTVCVPAILFFLILVKMLTFYNGIREINVMGKNTEFYTDMELIDYLDLLESLDVDAINNL